MGVRRARWVLAGWAAGRQCFKRTAKREHPVGSGSGFPPRAETRQVQGSGQPLRLRCLSSSDMMAGVVMTVAASSLV